MTITYIHEVTRSSRETNVVRKQLSLALMSSPPALQSHLFASGHGVCIHVTTVLLLFTVWYTSSWLSVLDNLQSQPSILEW